MEICQKICYYVLEVKGKDNERGNTFVFLAFSILKNIEKLLSSEFV